MIKKNKLIITINIFLIFFIFSCTTKIDKKIYRGKIELVKLDSIKMPLDFVPNLKVYKSNFIIADPFSNKIIVVNRNGKIIREIGGKGKAPGEFIGLLNLHFIDGNFYVLDYKLKRITVYDSLLNLKNTFILKHQFDSRLIKYGDNIVTFGGRENYKNKVMHNKYKIGDLYKKENNNWIFDKEIIKIRGFDKRLLDYYFSPLIEPYLLENKIYIFLSFLDKVVVYNIERDSVSYIPFYFPEFRNIKKVKRLKSLLKKYKKKYQKTSSFCSSPKAFFYHPKKQIFLTEFSNPFQDWYEKEMSDKKYFKYTIVLFDKNFNYLASTKTNQEIFDVEIKKDKFVLYSTEIFQYFLGEEEPDDIYLNVYEIDLNRF